MNMEPVRESFKTHSRATFDPVGRITRRVIERTQELVVIKVNQEVWKIALEAARGEVNRIEIISETEVLIHNRRVR